MSWIARLSTTGLAAALLLAGCGDTTATGEDAGSPGMDAGEADDCAGATDGTSCGSAMICVSESCVASRCGDGIVDPTAGEDCDDGNETAFDGCEPSTCDFTCTTDEVCDDAQPCNGAEVCGESSHACENGEALAEGTPCDRAGVPDGVCRGAGTDATCADPGCGNGVVDGAEDCDDGNTDNGDGCDNDCTYTCETDADCAELDMDVCDGADVCDTAAHTCGPGTALDCDDGLDCTDDSCDATTGCVNEDNGTGDFYYVDCDEDDYAFNDTGAERYCTAPTSPPGVCGGGGAWTLTRPIGGDVDCLDSDAMVNPDSDTFRDTAISGATAPADFDYNCDGEEELERPVRTDGICTCSGSGEEWYYSDMTPAVCGERQTYRWVCSNSTGSCVGHWERTGASHVVRCR